LIKGAGHITGMRRTEMRLNQLTDVNIVHLRPVYFFTNLFANIEPIASMGIMGGNFSLPAKQFPLAHPTDVAAVAADALMRRNFFGQSFRYIASDECGTDEIAAALGMAIGKPDLRWVQFTDEQLSQALMRAGFSKETIPEFVEGFGAFNGGKLFEDYWMNHPKTLGPTKLDEFAKSFAIVYNLKQETLKEA